MGSSEKDGTEFEQRELTPHVVHRSGRTTVFFCDYSCRWYLHTMPKVRIICDRICGERMK